jgi:preprotein translocase subunit SecY
MEAGRERTPDARETFMQMAQAAGLRGRILVTLGLLVVARLGIFTPLPGIDRARFSADVASSPIIGFLDIFSGGGLSAVGIFALGIIPYINASIIIQLLTSAIPSLERLQKEEGEAGRRKISQITRYVSVGWAIANSIGIALWLRNYRIPTYSTEVLFVITTVIALVAGSMFVMWLSELITERGVGNGASLLIFANIVAVFPKSFSDTIAQAQENNQVLGKAIVLLFVFTLTIVGIVFVQEGTRRIPIISARRQVGRRLYRERTNYLPLRLNQGGVMPIIFASSVMILPSALAQFAQNSSVGQPNNTVLSGLANGLTNVANFLNPSGNTAWAYALLEVVLIVFFSYFYSSLVVNPIDLSQNLKKMGASIPGVRPGRATSEYVEGVLNRLTLLGAVFLGMVAIVPTAIESSLGITTFKGFGATSLLILVGVAIDTAKQIQTYVISQRYEGMVKQ